MAERRLIELTIDEENEELGVNAISIVERPAFSNTFVAFSEEHKQKFAEVNKEERLLAGAFLIPNKKVVRIDENHEEYDVFFSAETIKKMSQLYFKRNYQKNSNVEHREPFVGATVVESWIVEDSAKDKQQVYGFNYPAGTWFGVMKIDNNAIWENYVKTGEVKGFSVEGMFKENEADFTEDQVIDELKKMLNEATGI